MTIPESFISDLLNRVDIVDVIERTVKLKKTGKNLMACCPFHKEKTPSFCVTPQKQIFKCFGCGIGGTAINFVMHNEGLNYPEAIRRLAEMVGMQVPEDRFDQKRQSKVKSLTERMQEAEDFYRQSLRGSDRCINYLKNREIKGETAARFALGYSPDEWQALESVFKEHYKDKELEEGDGCGLVIVAENERRYDRFRGRLMFPIRNPKGQVIGFGARTLNGDEHPKYLNSPETPIYHKGLEIYGLYEAQSHIREKARAIVCEGYMDVIQLSQAGFRESVAALGTAITPDHVRKLLKIVDTLYFSFDGDSAGQHALRRALEAALPVVGDTQNVCFIVLPEEHDPDSLIKEKGPAGFEQAIAGALTLSQYLMKSVSEGKDMSTPEGRSQFLTESKPLLVSMQHAPMLRRQIIGEIAMHVRMSPDEVETFFGIARPIAKSPIVEKPQWKNRYAKKSADVLVKPKKTATMTERVLQNLLNFPVLCAEFSDAIENEFTGSEDKTYQRIVEVWRSACSGEKSVTQPQVLLELLHASPDLEVYRQMVDDEMILQTPLEAARVEVDIALKRLELELIKVKLIEESSSANPDLVRLKALYDREKVLSAVIEKIRQSFVNFQT